MEYQRNFTKNPVAQRVMYDQSAREAKAEKVLAVLRDHLGDLSGLTLLDMSCSTGTMTNRFAGSFARAVGIDIDEKAVAHARARHGDGRAEYAVMDALHARFPDEFFDVIVCNHMYEHVPDPEQLMKEIGRLLKPDGVCYFGAGNRLMIIEPHYGHIPFLSWLPKPLAHRYLRILGRGDHYYETLRTHGGLRRLCRDFRVIDYTRQVARDPARFEATDVLPPGGLRHLLARVLVRVAYWALPGYIWLLERPPSARSPDDSGT